MTDRTPLGYPLVLDGVVLITSDVAVSLVALLDPGLRKRRADGYRLTDTEALVVRSLETLARLHRGESPTSSAEPIVWLSTKVAAERAGTSMEAVRKAAMRGTIHSRLVGRLVEVSESSVALWIEQRAARAANLRQPSPTAQTRRSA